MYFSSEIPHFLPSSMGGAKYICFVETYEFIAWTISIKVSFFFKIKIFFYMIIVLFSLSKFLVVNRTKIKYTSNNLSGIHNENQFHIWCLFTHLLLFFLMVSYISVVRNETSLFFLWLMHISYLFIKQNEIGWFTLKLLFEIFILHIIRFHLFIYFLMFLTNVFYLLYTYIF